MRSMVIIFSIQLIFNCIACNNEHTARGMRRLTSGSSDSIKDLSNQDDFKPHTAMLVLPGKPLPGEPFRIMATGAENIRKTGIIITGKQGTVKSIKSIKGDEIPYWRIDDFPGIPAGKYKAELVADRKVTGELEFEIAPRKVAKEADMIWKTMRGWDSSMEALYSAWINALFYGYDEDTSWPALHKVTQNKDKNFLYNYLSLDEDDPARKNSLFMEPDCADNPFFLRAYFAWKLRLPFGYHLCDRGSLTKNPKTGKWITNETPVSGTNQTSIFNAFLRKVADGVHSGTARTALDDENSDYYPVPLERWALRPGTVFADPYGHTLILVSLLQQTSNKPGLLLAVDAQPDGTVGIKRFWKGNFLFNTSGVIGEPGFKTFRPITVLNGTLHPLKNDELTKSAGIVPFSLQQRKMKTDVFYHTMERVINPRPLDPETALLDQISALYEQLKVRVTSVANGEAYCKSHPGVIIPMPSSATGIFLAGGQWENFSTPNRDLRLLIAMDAVLDFPDKVAGSPQDFNISGMKSPLQVHNMLRSILDKRTSEISISYTRSDGSVKNLTIAEILERKDAFEMAYNPNDGTEIRWGAPENSPERSTCHRYAPSRQIETMRSARVWFHKRLHPPT